MNNDLEKIKDAVEKNYGKVSDRALDLLATYNYDGKLLEAIESKGTFESLPESALECDWRPYYCDDCNTWHECYVGWGLIVDSEGIYGAIATYECDDWENEYHDLTYPGDEQWYFQSIEEEYVFPEKEYLQWVLETKDDPLSYLSVGINSNRVNCSINLTFEKRDGDIALVDFSVTPPKGQEMTDKMEVISDRLQKSPEYFSKLLWSDFKLKEGVESKNVIDHFEITEESLSWLKENIKGDKETFDLDGTWDLPDDVCLDILVKKAEKALKDLSR